MFDCKWLLDTNMHTESWHNQLKTNIMELVRNHRVDELMRILRMSETVYYCKWARTTQLGVRQLADPAWLLMRGETTPQVISRPSCTSSPEPVWSNFVGKEQTCRSTNYKNLITELLHECLGLIKTKDVEPMRLQSVLKVVRSVASVLRNSVDSLVDTVDTGTVPTTALQNNHNHADESSDGTSAETPSFKKRKKKMMSPVKPKYEPKKKKKFANVTSVKALVKHADTRHNLATSFQLNAVGWASLKPPKIFPCLDVKKVELRVIKRGPIVTLGGIVFVPMIGGVVIKDHTTSQGFVSLNVRVGQVKCDSPAHLKGVTSQHFLHKMRTISTTKRTGRRRYGAMRTVGSREYRTTYTNTIKFDELMSSVHKDLTRAYVDDKELEITLVSYIKYTLCNIK